jgi:DNA processing protein
LEKPIKNKENRVMRTYLWSKIIDLAYSVKTMKMMYLDYMHNLSEKEFLTKYLCKQKLNRNAIDYLSFKTIEEKLGFKIITIYDKEYPTKLKFSIDPPIAFYYIGNIDLLEKFTVAVVGSRIAPDRYKKIAKNLGIGLGKMEIIGISGLAKGIDASFHEGIDVSLGVLGCGIDTIYPIANEVLYQKLKNRGGLISEYPLKSKPLPWHFPRRNRLIAGLCDLLILIYAKERSGSIITLDFALDLGRDIFLTKEMYDRLDLTGYSINEIKKHIK